MMPHDLSDLLQMIKDLELRILYLEKKLDSPKEPLDVEVDGWYWRY